MRSRTIKGWAAVHKWTSIVCTAFLLMLCITGLPLIFHDEIDAVIQPRAPVAAIRGGARLLSLDAILAKALATRPGEIPLYMSFDEDRPVVNVTTGPRPDTVHEMYFQSLDRRTGTRIPVPPPGGIMVLLLRFHTDMLLGPVAEYFLGAMGLLFVIAIISGIVLYVPFMARLPFGTVRRARRARVRWTDLHNLIGIATAMWALVVGLTGVVNTLVVPVTDYWKARELAVMGAPYKNEPIPTRTASIQAAVATAMAAAPGMRPQFVAFPGVTYSSNHHMTVFLQGSTLQTKRLLTPVMIDARSGRLAAARPMPWYMQALLLSQPLHFGDYGGMAMKIIWAVLDLLTIVVLGSGLFLWLRRGSGRVNSGPA